MSALLRFFKSRVTIVAFLILAQIGLIALSVSYFWDYIAIYYGLSTVLALILVCHIVSKHDNPAYKIAWIILILTVPPFGGAMYIIFSGNTFTKRLKRKLAGMFSVMRVLPKEYKFESDATIEKPTSGTCLKFLLSSLDQTELKIGPEGGEYDKNNSYVTITYDSINKKYQYSVQIQEVYNGKKKGIPYTQYENILGSSDKNNLIKLKLIEEIKLIK